MKKHLISIAIVLLVLAAGMMMYALHLANRQAAEYNGLPQTEAEQTTAQEPEPTAAGAENGEKAVSPEPVGDIGVAQAEALSGKVCWGYQVFDADLGYRTASEKVPSASVIKVFIMEYAYSLIADGQLSLENTVSGVSVKNLLHAMITRSDNDATNILIDHFGMETLNTFFAEQGYQDTKVQRRMLDTKAMQEGRDNYTSLNDVMAFLDKLYQNRESFPYSEMLETMKQQQVRTKIPRNIPEAVVANKTGELSNVENDIGIVFTDKGDFAVAFLCSSLSDPASARNFISNTTRELYQKILE